MHSPDPLEVNMRRRPLPQKQYLVGCHGEILGNPFSKSPQNGKKALLRGGFCSASSLSFFFPFYSLFFRLFFLSPRFRISSASSSELLFKIQNCWLEKSWLLLLFSFLSLVIFSSSPAQHLSRSLFFFSPDTFFDLFFFLLVRNPSFAIFPFRLNFIFSSSTTPLSFVFALSFM